MHYCVRMVIVGILIINFIAGKIEFKPSIISKITTFFQMITIIALLLHFVHSNWLWNITVVLTVISGLDYIRIGSGLINGKSQMLTLFWTINGQRH